MIFSKGLWFSLKIFFYRCSVSWVLARIVEHGICFSKVKKRMATWAAENETQQKKIAAELLGSWYAKAAVAQGPLRDNGEGFSVQWTDVQAFSLDVHSATYTQLFSCVDSSALAESESLQGFAKAFGYSVTAINGFYGHIDWQVDFKQAF